MERKPDPKKKGTRCDYDAMARDYRTARFTDQELGDKYGKSRQAVTKMAKVKGWVKDLSAAVRQATNAGLIAEAAREKVAEAVAKGSNATVDVVAAAALTNTQVIIKHRRNIQEANQLLDLQMGELKTVSLQPNKLRALMDILTGDGDMTAGELEDARIAFANLMAQPTRSLSLQRMCQTMARLQQLERTAFGLDDPDDKPPPPEEAGDLSDEELEARIKERSERLTKKA